LKKRNVDDAMLTSSTQTEEKTHRADDENTRQTCFGTKASPRPGYRTSDDRREEARQDMSRELCAEDRAFKFLSCTLKFMFRFSYAKLRRPDLFWDFTPVRRREPRRKNSSVFCEREALVCWERNGRAGRIAKFSSGNYKKDQS